MACCSVAMLWPMWVNMSCLFVSWIAAGTVVGTYYSAMVVGTAALLGLACIIAAKLTPLSHYDDAIFFLAPLCVLLALAFVEMDFGHNDQCVPFDALYMFLSAMAAVAYLACGIGSAIGFFSTDTELCVLLLQCLPAWEGDVLTVRLFYHLKWLTKMTAERPQLPWPTSPQGHLPARVLRRVLYFGKKLVAAEDGVRPFAMSAYRSVWKAVGDLLVNVNVFPSEQQKGVKGALLALLGRFPPRALRDSLIHDKLADYFLLLCKTLTRSDMQALLHTVGTAAACCKPWLSPLLQRRGTIWLNQKHYMFDMICLTHCIPQDDMFVLAIDPAFDPEQTEYRPQALAFKQRVLRWHWRAARRHWCALHIVADVRRCR